MRISVGIDIAKEVHWVTAIDAEGVVRLDRKLENTPAAIAALVDELAALGGTVRIGLDVVGGIAGLAEAMLAEAGFALVHVPGLAVNRARQGTVGGENKSDPRDARVIADQVRTRRDLRPIEPATELDLEIRLLVGRRRDLVDAQTQRLGAPARPARRHLSRAWSACLDLTTKGAAASADPLRHAGRAARRRQASASSATCRPPAACPMSRRWPIAALAAARRADHRRAGRAHDRPPDPRARRRGAGHPRPARSSSTASWRRCSPATLTRPSSAACPAWGPCSPPSSSPRQASFARFRSADALAAAAGIAPVLRQSGKIRFLRRPAGGNKALKRVFYQSAFCSLAHPDSRAFYDRKRREGKRHHQAVIALARRRVNVLWAILHSRTPFQPGFKTAA